MLALDMTKNLKQKPSTTSRAVYQHGLDDGPSLHGEEYDYLDDNFAPDGIDTPSDDICYVHKRNFKRTLHVKSLIPRTQSGKPISKKDIPLITKCNGPVYLPTHIRNMLSEDIKKELDKHNQEKEAQYEPTCPRMAKVHDQENKKPDSPDHPEPDLEN